jgi:hypothetical protein
MVDGVDITLEAVQAHHALVEKYLPGHNARIAAREAESAARQAAKSTQAA